MYIAIEGARPNQVEAVSHEMSLLLERSTIISFPTEMTISGESLLLDEYLSKQLKYLERETDFHLMNRRTIVQAHTLLHPAVTWQTRFGVKMARLGSIIRKVSTRFDCPSLVVILNNYHQIDRQYTSMESQRIFELRLCYLAEQAGYCSAAQVGLRCGHRHSREIAKDILQLAGSLSSLN